MASQRTSDEHERSAAGLDYDEQNNVRDNAAKLGAKMAEDGPEALLDEIERVVI
jgi:hypothetical protein